LQLIRHFLVATTLFESALIAPIGVTPNGIM
jgi:hypothetical protein